MKQKQYILHSLIIEVTMVLLASMVAFQVCNMLGIRMSLIPLVMVIGYVIQKLLYHLCCISARYIVDAIPPSLLISIKKCVSKKIQPLAYSPTSNCKEVQKKRMELQPKFISRSVPPSLKSRWRTLLGISLFNII